MTVCTYHFTIPDRFHVDYATHSLGIAPYAIRKRDGKRVRAGRALFRVRLHRDRSDYSFKAVARLQDVLSTVCRLLNGGWTWHGPKTIDADRLTEASIESMMLPPAQSTQS